MADQTRRWAYAATLAGGALILAGAGMMIFFWALVGGLGWTSGWWTPGHHDVMRVGWPIGWFMVWGVLAGGIVLWAGIRLRPGGPGEGTAEGVMAIVGSVLSFPAMGGFMFGALLGVVGGALALASADEGREP